MTCGVCGMTPDGKSRGTPFEDLPIAHDVPGVQDAARFLARYGGHPASAKDTGRAVERFFSHLQRRFNPLFGRNGYRTLLEHAHVRAVKEHPVLEKWPVEPDGNPFFGGMDELASNEDGPAVWNGSLALTTHFLDLLNRLARRGEMDGLDELETWGDTVAELEHAASGDKAQGHEGTTRSHAPWRLLVMDRDMATCQAIAHALDRARDFTVADYCLSSEEVVEKMKAEGIDFVVASGHLPAEEILQVCRWLRREHTGQPPHVVITGLPEDDALILRFLEAGAAAVTLEEFSVEGLRLNIRLLARGEAIFPLRLQHLLSLRLSELAELVRDRGLDPDTLSNLTAREEEVLELLEEGLTNRQIARRLYVSEGTVKSHVHQILRKLKVRDREEAVRVLRLERASSG